MGEGHGRCDLSTVGLAHQQHRIIAGGERAVDVGIESNTVQRHHGNGVGTRNFEQHAVAPLIHPASVMQHSARMALPPDGPQQAQPRPWLAKAVLASFDPKPLWRAICATESWRGDAAPQSGQAHGWAKSAASRISSKGPHSAQR
jgi:hypothetical protein